MHYIFGSESSPSVGGPSNRSPGGPSGPSQEASTRPSGRSVGRLSRPPQTHPTSPPPLPPPLPPPPSASVYVRSNSLGSINEELTCCHRATWCDPSLRDVIVTDTVFTNFCSRFTYADLFWIVTVLAMVFFVYAILFFYVGDPMLPGGRIFGLFLVIIFVYVLGWSLAYIPYLQLPPFFGMLLAGVIVRNADWYNMQEELDSSMRANIRTFAIAFVMLRAGLQLTSTGLYEYPLVVMNLALIPCTAELLMIALCSWSILGYTWSFSFLTGSIIACISPVVPVNCMLALADHGYGEDKDIATILVTAASIDDIHIMSLYSIFFTFVFSEDKLQTQWWSFIPGALRDFILGVVAGFMLGLFFVFFPHRNHKYVFLYRMTFLILGSLMCTTAPQQLSITGGSWLAVILMSLIATTGWRILTVPYNVEPLRKSIYIIWHFMQPILVGIMAAELDFRELSPPRTGLYILVIFLGILVRSIFAFLSTWRRSFNMKERLFVTLAWISKGTLQAVLAPMVLEQAKQTKDQQMIEFGIDVVRMSVIAILILAPAGAIIIMVSGPLLLTKTTDEEVRRRRELSYLRIVSLQPIRHRRTTTRKTIQA